MNAQHTERGQRPSALGAERDVYNLVTTFFRFLVSAICFTTEEFLAELYNAFVANGRAAIERVAEEDPAAFLRIVVSLIPKEEKVETNLLAGLTEAELHALAQAAQKAVIRAEAASEATGSDT